MCPSREMEPGRGRVREVFKDTVQELGANSVARFVQEDFMSNQQHL